MSVASHYAELASLSISGVNNYSAPPERFNSADLPLKYVRVAQNQQSVATITNSFGLNTIAYEVVVVVEMFGLSDNLTNQTLLISIMDTLITQLDTIDNITTYSTSVEMLRTRDNAFWSLIASVTYVD